MGDNTMKYVKQFGIILLFSLAGDLCHRLLPFPIPASIYGMVLLLVCLALKWVKVEAVKETGTFLVSLLPLLFVVPTVALMEYWHLVKPVLIPFALISFVVTILVFAASGLVTKWIIRKGGNGND